MSMAMRACVVLLVAVAVLALGAHARGSGPVRACKNASDALSLNNQGMEFARKNTWARAVICLRAATEREPQQVEFAFNFAVALLHTSVPQKSVYPLRTCVRQGMDSAEMWALLERVERHFLGKRETFPLPARDSRAAQHFPPPLDVPVDKNEAEFKWYVPGEAAGSEAAVAVAGDQAAPAALDHACSRADIAALQAQLAEVRERLRFTVDPPRASAGGATKPLWMEYHHIRLVHMMLDPSYVVVQWGADEGVLLFSHYVKNMFVVEHRPKKCAWLEERVRTLDIKNVYLRCVEEWSWPDRTVPPSLAGFVHYIRAANVLGTGVVDVAITTGLAVPQISVEAVSLLRPSGTFIALNSDWQGHANHIERNYFEVMRAEAPYLVEADGAFPALPLVDNRVGMRETGPWEPPFTPYSAVVYRRKLGGLRAIYPVPDWW